MRTHTETEPTIDGGIVIDQHLWDGPPLAADERHVPRLAKMEHLCGICWSPCDVSVDVNGDVHVRCDCGFAIVIDAAVAR